MRRLTATLLLLFALAGNFAPVALAATADLPHACCVRKAAHPCHGSAAIQSESLTMHGSACCHQDCCCAVTSRWAQTHARLTILVTLAIDARVLSPCVNRPSAEILEFRSTRAPPHSSLS